MSMILRCDAPACTAKAVVYGAMPAGWIVTHNVNGWMVHAHDATHKAAAEATTGNTATVAVA